MKVSDDEKEKPPRAERLENVVIRAACPDDAEAITALHNLPGYRYGTLRTPFHSVTDIRRSLENPTGDGRRLVADLNGQVIGDIGLTLAGNPRRRHTASIGMGVHDEFAGHGVGSALMTAVLNIADNWLNLRRVELTVFTDNEPAIRLYERHGFVTEGCLKQFAFRDGHYVDAFTMARLKT